MNIKETKNGVLLEGVPDFDAKHIFECGQSFRWSREEDGSYTGVAYGRVINVASDYSRREVIIKNTSLADFHSIWFDYFDLGRDYGEIKKVLAKDPTMETAITYGAGIRILNQEPWELLVSFIISSNNSIPNISRCIGMLSQVYGKTLEYEGRQYFTFPTAKELSNASAEKLTECKTGYRCKYICDAVRMVINKEVDLLHIKSLDMDSARKELMRVPGVGPKVADCIMLFSMQHHAAYPVDVWIKRGTEQFFIHKEVSAKDIQSFAKEKFGDLAGFAQQYLFYFARNMK